MATKLRCGDCDLLWQCLLNYDHDPDMDPWDEGCDALGPEPLYEEEDEA